MIVCLFACFPVNYVFIWLIVCLFGCLSVSLCDYLGGCSFVSLYARVLVLLLACVFVLTFGVCLFGCSFDCLLVWLLFICVCLRLVWLVVC